MASHFPLSISGVVNTSTTRVLTLTPSYPCSIYIELFTLDPTETLWKTCPKYSTKLLVHQTLRSLSGVCLLGWWQTFPHLVALPQSHSYLELVVLGQWWCTMPAQLTQPYKGECPSQEWWEKVSLGGGLLSVLSAGSSWGIKGCTISDLEFHFIPFLLQWVLHFPISFVGVSFSQDKASLFPAKWH